MPISKILTVILLYIVGINIISQASAQGTLWQCSAIDNDGKQWAGTGYYPKNAMEKAKELCKKQSDNPWKCYTSRELCRIFSLGDSREEYWRCTAFDKSNGTWKSGPYGNRLNAAKGAMQYCKYFSKKPDSCFLHFVTCKQGH